MFKIYTDCDQVLTNFSKKFEKLGHGTPEEFEEKNSQEAMWFLINSKTDHFWRDIEWMPDGKKFWNFIKDYNPTILSRSAPVKNSKEDKTEWLKKEIGKDVPIIITSKKEKYANENSILIDDMQKNIDKWEDSGGIGLLYINANKAIKELKQILKKQDFSQAKTLDSLIKIASLFDEDADTIIGHFEKATKEEDKQTHKNKVLAKISALINEIDQTENISQIKSFREDTQTIEDFTVLGNIRSRLVNIDTLIKNNNYDIHKPFTFIQRSSSYLEESPIKYRILVWLDEVARDLEKLK